MDLTQNNKIIAIAVVIALVAASAAGIWYATKDSAPNTPNTPDNPPDEDETYSANEIAEIFANAYEGKFGKYNIAEGSNAEKATVEAPTGASQSPYARITFSVTDDAATEFATLKGIVEGKPSMMGAEPVEIEDIEGFDKVVAYKLSPSMFGAKFTMIYFAAYSGNILVDGSANPAYHPGSEASDGIITHFFKKVSDASKGIGVLDAMNYAYRFSEMYSGVFGEYSIADNSTAEKATVEAPTGASQSPYARMSFSITDNAATEYTTLKGVVEGKPSMMGAAPVEIEGIEGFDKVVAYRLDPTMMGTTFTMIYFAAYSGNVLVDGSVNPAYHKGSAAPDDSVTYFFKKVSDVSKGVDALDAMDYAYMFSEAYSGAFGEYNVADNSTAEKATVEAETGASQSPYARMSFSITDNAATEFTALKGIVEGKPSIMGAAPVEIVGIEGFDKVVAYKLDPTMMGTTFTMIYFAAYSGNVLVDGSVNPAYHKGSAASDETIEEFFDVLSGILS